MIKHLMHLAYMAHQGDRFNVVHVHAETADEGSQLALLKLKDLGWSPKQTPEATFTFLGIVV